MGATRSWSDRVAVAGTIFLAFGVAHLIDDFLYGVPAEFNLSDTTAQLLGWIFFGALGGLLVLAARGSRESYRGLAIIGGLLALADILAHFPQILEPGAFRSGFLSGFFSVGLVVSGAALGAICVRALRASAG